MKTLLSTTALVITLGMPTLALAQSTAPADKPQTEQQSGQMNGFLATRNQSDLFASDLIGHDVHARRTQEDMTENNQANTSGNDMQDMAMMNRSDLENMDNIGQINEIVLSNDGKVRALVIGVGGFLGIGEQDVAVTMDQITFASDADDQSQMYVVVKTGSDVLTDAPAYDRTAMENESAQGDETNNRVTEDSNAAMENQDDTRNTAANDAAMGDDDARTARTGFAAPQMEREGYNRVEVTDVTTDMLMDKMVYDAQDNDVGTVTNMVLDDDGTVTEVVIDFGGFLGIGSSQIALNYDELTVLSNEGYADVRLYVDASKEQIRALPEHVAAR